MANEHNHFTESLSNTKTSKPNSYVSSDQINQQKAQTTATDLCQTQSNNNVPIETAPDNSSSTMASGAGNQDSTSSSSPPPIVYGELSILGYNGYIPNVERNGRRNRSKYLLCKRPTPNGIKKSRHYIVKQQPQTTRAIQDKDLHSISYTFSRSQTIIVEYRQDENTDMFQIGRSSEEPIDFVVMDTVPPPLAAQVDLNGHQAVGKSAHPNHQQLSENNQHQQQQQQQAPQQPILLNSSDIFNSYFAGGSRISRQIAKAAGNSAAAAAGGACGDELMNNHYPANTGPSNSNDQLATRQHATNNLNQHQQQLRSTHNQAQSVILNYAQPNLLNLPPVMMEHFRHHHNQHRESSSFAYQQQQLQLQQHHQPQANIAHQHHSHHQNLQQQPPQLHMGIPSAHRNLGGSNHNNFEQNHSSNGRHSIVGSHNAPKRGSHATQSTISRFACRILVDRHPPYKARIYAAGFDSSKNIFLGEKATKWEQNNTIDGLTTNGVLLMHAGGVWREVSVDGVIFAIRESRSAALKGKQIEDESNVLQDGTLIDLCGATLLWRSVDGFKSSPTKKTLEEKIDMLNATRPQCPVGLNTLIIPRKPIYNQLNHQHHKSTHKDHQPYVYLKCGHVQGFHNWGATDKANQRTCPICLSICTVAKLSMGLEPSFYVDSGPLTHVFNPCGHMASEKTVKYWCSIKIPHGTHFFHSICPFCATPLATNEPPLTKLIFQDDLD